MDAVRRLGAAGLTAILGAFLLLVGVALAAVDAQQRSDAATAAVALTPEQRALLDEPGFVGWDPVSMRHWMIVENLVSGGPMPTLVVEDGDSGQNWVSWGPDGGGYRVSSLGGWQLKPIALLPAAGLALLLGSGFVAAARWRPAASDPGAAAHAGPGATAPGSPTASTPRCPDAH